MEETARTLVQGGRSIDDTISALVNLQGRSGPDLQAQYSAFMRRVRQLEAQERKVLARQNSLELASKAYFDSWDAELKRFSSLELKKKSRERRQLAIDSFNRMFDALQVEEESYRVILNDLSDIRRYLGYDLTLQSVDSLKDEIKKVSADSLLVHQKIDQAVRELQLTRTPLPAETQAPPAPPGNPAPANTTPESAPQAQ
jgi:hypothetical protein